MTVRWDDRLLTASLRRARDWAGENPIWYSVVFGLPALAIQIAITAGVFRMGGVASTALSLVVVPIAVVGLMVVRTLLEMLYEVREALGAHIEAAAATGDAANFTCELADSDNRELAVRVTNHDTVGDFHAKVVDLRGFETSPVPIPVRWRGDDTADARRLNRGESDVLAVVRVRGRRAVDFLQPRTGRGGDHRRVAAAANGSDRHYTVAAVLQVFHQGSEGEACRSHLLELTFDDTREIPRAELTPLAEG